MAVRNICILEHVRSHQKVDPTYNAQSIDKAFITAETNCFNSSGSMEEYIMTMSRLCAHSEVTKLQILGISEQVTQQILPNIVRDMNEMVTLKYKYLLGELKRGGSNFVFEDNNIEHVAPNTHVNNASSSAHATTAPQQLPVPPSQETEVEQVSIPARHVRSIHIPQGAQASSTLPAPLSTTQESQAEAVSVQEKPSGIEDVSIEALLSGGFTDTDQLFANWDPSIIAPENTDDVATNKENSAMLGQTAEGQQIAFTPADGGILAPLASTGPSEYPKAAEETMTMPWGHAESPNADEISFPLLGEHDDTNEMDFEMDFEMGFQTEPEMDLEEEHEEEHDEEHDEEHEMDHETDQGGQFGLNFNPFKELGALPTESEHNEMLLNELDNAIGNAETGSPVNDEDDDWTKLV